MRDFTLDLRDIVDQIPQVPDQRILLRRVGPFCHADRQLGRMLAFLRRRTRRPVGAHRRCHALDFGLLLHDFLDLAHDLGGLLQRRAEIEVELGLVNLGN